MKKVSISRFTEKVIEQHGSDSAESVLIIAVNGEHITTSFIGPKPPFINDKSIALVVAMRTILDERFNLANSIYDRMKQSGRIRSELFEKVVDTSADDFAAVESEQQPKKQPQSKPEWNPKAKVIPEEEFALGLLDLLERTLGGSKNANDD